MGSCGRNPSRRNIRMLILTNVDSDSERRRTLQMFRTRKVLVERVSTLSGHGWSSEASFSSIKDTIVVVDPVEAVEKRPRFSKWLWKGVERLRGAAFQGGCGKHVGGSARPYVFHSLRQTRQIP